MTGGADSDYTAGATPTLLRTVALCDAYEATWRDGRRPEIEALLADVPPAEVESAFVRLLELEVELRSRAGETADPALYHRRFPALAHLIDRAVAAGARRRPRFPSLARSLAAGETVLLGDYELLARIGQGGMGVVYRARERGTGRVVAVKLIRPDILDALSDTVCRQAEERFRVEARAAGALAHDHIVAVYGAGQADGHRYYAMQYVEGRSLEEVINHRPVTAHVAATYLEPVAQAVAYAHARGVLHRDLKPSNVLIGTDGRPYVTDFGLAKFILTDSPRLTTSGTFLGTPAYVAPEVVAGQQADRFSPASDVYSLGASLYELLTGGPPFRAAEPMALLRQIVEDDPVAPSRIAPDVPRDLETICLKCLAKESGRRYLTAADLAADLGRFLAGVPIYGQRPGVAYRVTRWLHRRAVPVACAVVLAAAAAGVLAIWSANHADRIAAKTRAVQTIDLSEVPGLLQGLGADRPAVAGLIADWAAAAPADSGRAVRAALAGLPDVPRGFDFLYDQLLVRGPGEVKVLTDAVRADWPDRWREWEPRLWSVLSDETTSAPHRLRAGCALARQAHADARWSRSGSVVADALLAEAGADPAVTVVWVPLLLPVRDHLTARLRAGYVDARRPGQRIAAAGALAAVAHDRPADLVDLIRIADPDQLLPLATAWANHADQDGMLFTPPPTPRLGPDDLDASAKERANVVAVSLRVGRGADVLAGLDTPADASTRSYLIERLIALKVPPDRLLERIDRASPGCRQSLVLALGESPLALFEAAVREKAAAQLLSLYVEDKDPGVHSAAGWALLQWGRGRDADTARLPQFEPTRPPAAGWWKDAEGHTLAVVPGPARFEMVRNPDPIVDPTTQDVIRLTHPHSYAVATCKVTVDQYMRFLTDIGCQTPHDTRFFRRQFYDRTISPDGDCPINGVNFHAAACYCNWLSARAGLPREAWCYDISETDWLGPVHLRPDYRLRIGYRLLDEEEWVRAYRAGTTTRFYFGQSLKLLDRYEWSSDDSRGRTDRVGSKRPNPFGLHDLLGSLYEWCSPSPSAAAGTRPLLKGRPFTAEPRTFVAVRPSFAEPFFIDPRIGFRVARTLVCE